MKMKGFKVSPSPMTLVFIVLALSCVVGDKTDSGTKTAYVYIPGATFHQGAAPISSGTSSMHRVWATPSSSTLSVSTPVTWTIEWDTTITVTSIVIYEETLDGYFEIELTDDEVNAGSLVVDEVVSESPPTTQQCIRDYRGNGTCYEEAPQSTTDYDAQVSFIGEDASVGSYVEVSISLDFEWVAPVVDNGPDIDYDTCSGAVATCNCSLEACCNSSGTQCGYLVNGNTWYACNGTSCSAAANAVISACCPY